MSEQIQKQFKSRLIVFEGGDGTGKSFHIDQLTKDYPGLFERIKFPTEEGKKKLVEFRKTMKKENIDDVVKYNLLFIEDIINFQPTLNEMLFRNRNQKHVLCDRYYFSSLAYFKQDINLYFGPGKQQAFSKWNALKEQVLHKWINQCRVPDHVLLLINNFKDKTEESFDGLKVYTHEDLLQINDIYKEEVQKYWEYLDKKHRQNFVYEQVEAFAHTEHIIQNYLLGHGIVDQLIAKQ